MHRRGVRRDEALRDAVRSMTEYTIRENATGIERTKSDPDLGSLCDFWWVEGNMACDCNRKLEWYRAGPEDQPDLDPDVDFPCSEGKYTLVSVKVNGIEIVRENEATEHARCD